ncbi:recombinase family protein [Streptomyces sp. YIM S03343]
MPFDPSYLHLVFPGTRFEALLYGRASRDPNKRGDSVEDQLVAGRALCRQYGWHITEEFKDLGLSASRHAKQTRDDFEDLLASIEGAPAQPSVTRIVVAYEASRYYRDLEAYVRLRRACLNSGALLCYKGTVYDLSRSDDRKATAQHAIDAEAEADDIQTRNLRTAARTRAAGDPHGRLVFGYARDYEVVNGQLRCVRQYEHPVTGQYVYQALRRIDEGRSVLSVTRWLNSQPESARLDGRLWRTQTVRLMLLNRAYLGERKNLGDWTPAAWPAIKGLETPAGRALFNRVTAKLTDPQRRMGRGSGPRHLLSLIAMCGECGDHALLDPVVLKADRFHLRCRERKDVVIREDWLDAYVEEAVIGWFADKSTATAALVPEDADVEDKITAIQRRILGYEEQLDEARSLSETFDEETGRFRLSATAFAAMEQRLQPKLDAEKKRLETMTGVSPLLLALLNAPDPDVVWNGRDETERDPGLPGLTLEQKREVIRGVVTVRVRKAKLKGPRRLDPDRISLSFAGTPGFRDRPLHAPGTAPAAPQQGPASGT